MSAPFEYCDVKIIAKCETHVEFCVEAPIWPHLAGDASNEQVIEMRQFIEDAIREKLERARGAAAQQGVKG